MLLRTCVQTCVQFVSQLLFAICPSRICHRLHKSLHIHLLSHVCNPLCFWMSCRWGGSPRYVLQKVERDSQNNLERAIGAAHVNGIQDAMGMQEFPPHAREDILHMRVGPDFIETSTTMASPYVSERVAYKLWRTEKEALRTFLGVVRSGKGHLCSVRANLWEGFCLGSAMQDWPGGVSTGSGICCQWSRRLSSRKRCQAPPPLHPPRR